MKLHQATTIITALVALSSSFCFKPVSAQQEFDALSDPGFIFGSGISYGYGWDLQSFTGAVNQYIGGMRFSDDGNWFCAVRETKYAEAGMICDRIVRDPADGRYVLAPKLLLVATSHIATKQRESLNDRRCRIDTRLVILTSACPMLSILLSSCVGYK